MYGLRQRIQWCVNHDRPTEEIVKLVELLLATGERYVSDAALELFYDNLQQPFTEET